MADGFIQLPSDGPGKKLRTRDRGVAGHDQYVVPTDLRAVSYKGRASSWAIPGRAGTTGQKIFALHNATGSAVLVDVKKVWYDVMQTAAKLIEPAKVRAEKFTTVPTNGSAVTKAPMDSALSSSASVTLWQDAQSDGTGSGTALTVTLPATRQILAEEWAARALTLTGYEQFDRPVVLEGSECTLRALEGIAVFLDYTVAGANPTTDRWLVGCEWEEYTLP